MTSAFTPTLSFPSMSSSSEVCSNCGSTSFAITYIEIVCRRCGLIIEDHPIDDHHNSYDACDRYGGLALQSELDKQKHDSAEVFRDIGLTVPGVDEKVMADAMRIYDKLGHRRGENKRVQSAACLYYALRQVNGGRRTKSELCKWMSICETAFSKECTVVKLVLFADPNLAYLTRVDNNTRKEDTLRRMINITQDIPTPREQEVVRAVHKIHDKLMLTSHGQKVVSSAIPEKLSACLIYVACKALGIHLKMKSFSKIVDCSSTTIWKMETQIMKLLSERIVKA